ncbi:MAG TPA: AAA family ATPase [Bryobacteraceae bacterium]|nr:AAA family ATPase [Bryobacteraceae bacterium]
MYLLTLGLAIETKELWNELQSCLPALPLRPVIEHQDMSNMGNFLERLERLRPEVVLLDVAATKEPLSDLIPTVRSKVPEATIVALHTSADPDAILNAMRAGVNEYIYPPLESALRGALDRRSTDAGRRQSGMRWGGRTVGFFSSKGGCGATTVVCHLAVELGRHGQKVLLADLDLDAGLIGFLTKAKPGYSILDAVNNLHRMDVSYWKALVSNGIPGVEIIAAPGATQDKTYPRQEQLRQLFSFLRSCYDFTLIDLGRSLTRVGVAALEEMDEAYLVSTLEVPALHQAKQVLQILMDAGYGKDRLKLILNRVPKRSELAPEEIEKILGLPVYAVLPSSYPELHECYSLGKLLPERSFLGKQIKELAMRMAGVDEQKPKKKFGLFG